MQNCWGCMGWKLTPGLILGPYQKPFWGQICGGQILRGIIRFGPTTIPVAGGGKNGEWAV